MSDLKWLLEPRSVAVVGASRDPSKRGHQAVRRLVEDGFEGAIYPINPNAAEIAGVAAYASILDVPAPVDLALIAVPARDVPEALEACGRHGVKAVVVLAVGFRESGPAGSALEAQIVDICRNYGMRLVGPNTSGIFNLHEGVNLVGMADIPSGPIGVLSQSGNVILGLIADAAEHCTGFSAYVGVGNVADVGYDELIAFLNDDHRTGAVAIYGEGFSNGRSFLRQVRKTVVDKPIVMLKAGRSEVGSISAASHTGALAGDHRVVDSVLRQAGVITVRRFDELLAVTDTLARLPRITGRRIAVLADGGGYATMAADVLSDCGVELPRLQPETQQALGELLPDAASLINPVDVAGGADGDPGIFSSLIEILSRDGQIDGVLIVGLYGGYAHRFSSSYAEAEELCSREIARLMHSSGKPIVVQSLYARTGSPALDLLEAGGIPVHQSIDIAARCMSALVERHRYLSTQDQRSDFGGIADRDMGAPQQALSEVEARESLVSEGIPVVDWVVATTPEDASAAAARMGGPVALKIVSPDIAHKSDIGGVALNVDSPNAAAAFRSIVDSVARLAPQAAISGVMVSPMIRSGIELLIGVTNEPSFGRVVAVGLGGTLVEVVRRVAFRALPITALEANEALDELGAALFDGFRGMAPSRKEVINLLLAVSDMMTRRPEIRELELNPVILGPQGPAVVDARIVKASE